jgi:hypothetical protein
MSAFRPKVLLTTPVEFSRHAVERYEERVRPGLSHARLSEELLRMASAGRIVPAPPRWVAWDLRSPLYLELGDVVFPLRRSGEGSSWIAATCLVRGSLSPHARKSKTLRRRRRSRRGRLALEVAR